MFIWDELSTTIWAVVNDVICGDNNTRTCEVDNDEIIIVASDDMLAVLIAGIWIVVNILICVVFNT